MNRTSNLRRAALSVGVAVSRSSRWRVHRPRHRAEPRRPRRPRRRRPRRRRPPRRPPRRRRRRPRRRPPPPPPRRRRPPRRRHTTTTTVPPTTTTAPPSPVSTPVSFDCRTQASISTSFNTLQNGVTSLRPDLGPGGAELPGDAHARPDRGADHRWRLPIRNLNTVRVRFTVPAGATFVSATLSGGSNLGTGAPSVAHSGGIVTLSVPGQLAPGTTRCAADGHRHAQRQRCARHGARRTLRRQQLRQPVDPVHRSGRCSVARQHQRHHQVLLSAEPGGRHHHDQLM